MFDDFCGANELITHLKYSFVGKEEAIVQSHLKTALLQHM